MEKMKTALSHCEICPRGCGINRTAGKTGWCHAPLLPKVALVSGHLWEEPPISGTKGSGTIFFSHCNLGCVFCQNHTISQEGFSVCRKFFWNSRKEAFIISIWFPRCSLFRRWQRLWNRQGRRGYGFPLSIIPTATNP